MAAGGAEKRAAAAAAADPVPEQQEEKEALFAAKHAELVSEARDVAREHGVAVTTVAFRPDGTAVADEVVGGGGGGVVGLQEQVRAMIQRAIERKVSAMESGELAAHRRELQMLRGIVVGELTKTRAAPGQKEKTDGEVVVGAKRAAEQQEKTDGEVVVVAKSAAGQQQETDGGAGCNKDQ